MNENGTPGFSSAATGRESKNVGPPKGSFSWWQIASWVASLGINVAAMVICAHYSQTWTGLVLSFAFFLLPFGVALGLTGQWLRSATMAATLVLVTHLLSRLKVYYYKEPLFASDFYLVADSSNWATLAHYWDAALAFVGLAFCLAWAVYAHRHQRRAGFAIRVPALALAALALGLGWQQSHDALAQAAWQASLPKGQGTFTNLIFSARQVAYTPPVLPGNDHPFLDQAAALGLTPHPTNSTRPDIVVWLQESTVNPEIYDLSGASLPALSMFQPDPATRTTGWLRVPTFGGATWLSEFAVFSGLLPRDFGDRKSVV
jgi:phosphoglycerol transferase MdoB-like AlkP superfamily enzyme